MGVTDSGLQAAQATAREVQGLLGQVLRTLRRR
jgi:hypothetical protein